MTAKMLNRQAGKAHKESEVQKAKVKKVCHSAGVGADEVGYSTRKQ